MAKKILAFLGMGLAATCSQGENRLFPTDILQQGEVDVRAAASYSTQSSNFNSFFGREASTPSHATSETIQARYGLGGNWHIGTALPYVSQAIGHIDYSNPPEHFTSRIGGITQDASVWATYGFINDADTPFSLNGELLARVDTTPHLTFHPLSYTGRLLAGWRDSDTLRLYSTLSRTTYTVSHDARLPDSSSLTFGAYKDISESITLVPHGSFRRVDATSHQSSITRQEVGLSADFQISGNTYLIPDASFSRTPAHYSKDGHLRFGPSNGKLVALSFYQLF